MDLIPPNRRNSGQPEQRDKRSVAGYAMYERSNPFHEYVAGGLLDMTNCRYEISEKTTRITGPVFVPAEEFRVKLEGSGKIGERFVGMVGIRDPYTIAHVDKVIEWARQQARERFGNEGQLHYTVYGRNGVMGDASGDAAEVNATRRVCVSCM